jgi:hypothetical protein
MAATYESHLFGLQLPQLLDELSDLPKHQPMLLRVVQHFISKPLLQTLTFSFLTWLLPV